LTFLFILSVLKRIQIYPKLQTWLTLRTVAGEHVQVIRDTQKKESFRAKGVHTFSKTVGWDGNVCSVAMR
jgi:hypothetical protein